MKKDALLAEVKIFNELKTSLESSLAEEENIKVLKIHDTCIYVMNEENTETRATEIYIGDVYSFLNEGDETIYTPYKRRGVNDELPGVLIYYTCDELILDIIIYDVKELFPKYIIYLQPKPLKGLHKGEVVYPE